MAEEKVRYSDEELAEFKALIMEKLEQARKLYKSYHEIITQQDGNDTVDTSPTFKSYEEGSSLLSKEQAGSMAERQLKFIKALENALIRIENKTYGIDRNTGKLIPKERLMAVPHATLSVESKKDERK
ncbi:MAG: TraR/DksA family transcriptional regulator [Bacteroidales bacterium]|jgi:RNA polymerase-binding transcription factor DksA|nr:TraR/DksA family transcriptional regulator [Bacteroidales bacterium]MBR2886743.1 TraR/DksA family transcriptional regulator [Bacteroidales bacterium]MDD6001821.1 TraR/DksA family transcriptional regulator [Bacteroidales bacterium]